MRPSLFLILFFLVLATRLQAGAAAPEFSAKLSPAAPCHPLVMAAQANHIPLEGIASPNDTNLLHPGDSLAALVTLSEKRGRRTQWLLRLEVDAPPATNKPSAKAPRPMVLYSSCGNRFEFPSSPVFVKLQTLGPFADPKEKRTPPKAKDEVARFSLDEGLLSLGLDRAAAAWLRMKQGGTQHGDLRFGPKPFGEAQVTQGRKAAASAQLTLEEERALAAGLPALFSYFNVVQQTQGLEDMMLRVVDLPSLWSILWERGVTPKLIFDTSRLRTAEHGLWGMEPSLALFYFPLRLDLNKHHALDVTLLVTSPRPPLLACGGVIGFLAEKPDEPETFLTLRLISTWRSGRQNGR